MDRHVQILKIGLVARRMDLSAETKRTFQYGLFVVKSKHVPLSFLADIWGDKETLKLT